MSSFYFDESDETGVSLKGKLSSLPFLLFLRHNLHKSLVLKDIANCKQLIGSTHERRIRLMQKPVAGAITTVFASVAFASSAVAGAKGIQPFNEGTVDCGIL